MILPSQALHQHCRHCLPAVSHDFALRGANFAGIGADFARVYPRPLYKKALAVPLPTLPSAESAVMALKHGIATVTLSQTKKPAPGMLDHSGRLEHQLLHHRLDAPALGNMAHRRIRLVQSVLPNQTQQVHRHCGQLAHQVVGVKLARRQTLQIHIAFELRMELLMGGVITIQRNDVSRAQPLWQRCRPAFEHVLGQQQSVAVFVYGALNQPVDAPGRVGIGADTGQFQALLPNALTLAKAINHSLCAAIGHLACSNRLHRCPARVPLDDEGDLTFKFKRLSRDFLHQLHRTKARIGSHQQSPRDKTCGHRQGALKVVLALRGRMLNARAQGQFQAIAQATQVHGKGAVAVNPDVSATNQLFLCAPVVHGKGIEVARGVATGQGTEVNGLAVDATAQQTLVHLSGQIKPGRGMGVQTLTQGGTRRNAAKPKSTHEEGVAPKVLDGVKVVFAQTQQGQVTFKDLAVGNARANREGWIDQRIKIDALEIFSNEGQTGVGAEVVGQLFDDKFGYGVAYLQGKQRFTPKSLIYKDKSAFI